MDFDDQHLALNQRSASARQRMSDALVLLRRGNMTADERAELAAAKKELTACTRAGHQLVRDMKAAMKNAVPK